MPAASLEAPSLAFRASRALTSFRRFHSVASVASCFSRPVKKQTAPRSMRELDRGAVAGMSRRGFSAGSRGFPEERCGRGGRSLLQMADALAEDRRVVPGKAEFRVGGVAADTVPVGAPDGDTAGDAAA